MRAALPLLALLALSSAGLARAQGMAAEAARGPLAAAEEAYLNVDFEGTRDRALEALRGGGLGPAQLARCYMLLGVASSALGEVDAARDYFVRMLGIDPDAELDESVNPQMRDPYLEARGMWAARTDRLGVEVGLDRATSSLRVALHDPLGAIRRVRVGARLEGETHFQTAEYRAAPALAASVTGAAEADRVEYFVELLDVHGNTVLQEGSAFDPRVVGRTRAEGGGGGGGVLEEPLFWVLTGLGLAAAAGGVAVGVVVDQRSRIGVRTVISVDIE